MIITTAGRTNDEMKKMAEKVAQELNGRYVERNKLSVQALQQREKQDCIVVGKERLELYPIGESEPFFFHPNSAMFRMKRLQKGEEDPFVEACSLEKGKSLLDCTMGLASDSIVASFVVGDVGKVTSVEGNPYLAYLVKEGLKAWDSGIPAMNQAMANISVVHSLSLSYLQTLPANSFDCVYFDPMFEEHILESDGIKALGSFAIYESLTNEIIAEALRVTRDRVVLKDHFRSTRFESFGFDVYKRKTAKFHFGVRMKK